jgi:hypothetical protein
MAAGGAAAAPLPAGLQFAMPAAQVDADALAADAVAPTDASLDELASMLSALNK